MMKRNIMANNKMIRQRNAPPPKDEYKIADSLCNIIGDIGAIEKTRTNTHQKYKFRGIDDALAALQPLLVKHNVVMAPSYSELTHSPLPEKGFVASVKLELRFVSTEDGSGVLVATYGTGTDFGDKALYKAMSGALKYAIFQTFCIPTEELKDAEEDSPEVSHVKPLTLDEEMEADSWKDALSKVSSHPQLEELKRSMMKLDSRIKGQLYDSYNLAKARLDNV
jgi:hypothetical protein